MSQIIDRVRALIAKAESSPFPHEADAFMAKAQKLIDEHAIDQARLKGADPSTVGHDQIPMSGSYTRERSMIWSSVARANRCQVLTLSAYRSNKVSDLTLVGRRQDRELVQLVATSLELQAMRRLADLPLDRTFEAPVVQRRSFLRGFAIEVADRLQRAHPQTTALTESAQQALVLAADAVDDYVASNFDVSRGRRSQARFDGAAYSRGRRAGAAADVGQARVGSNRRALPTSDRG